MEIKIAMLLPWPNQLTGASFGLTLFGGTWGLSATLDRVVCISAHEYPNSCPHFKQTWYVRFLIVNTALRWR